MDRADSLRRDRTQPEPIDALDAERVTFDELYERHRLDVYRYLRPSRVTGSSTQK